MSEKPYNPELFEGESPGLLQTDVTLRDLFAASVLHGLAGKTSTNKAGRVAKVAYEFADAMLAEREKRER